MLSMYSSAYIQTYSSGGNLLSKTGVGNYAYSSGSHRLSNVDNTDDVIPYSSQSITYNAWGKVAEVNETIGSDTYKYELTYGPDLQRVLAVLWKNNSLVHLVTYGDGYEEKYQNGHITYYYYVDGADGNSAVYTSHTQTGDKAYCIDRDHLGSVTALFDQNGNKCFSASFDPWGRRYVTSGSIEYDRGYTGHEHIDELGLIDMNGRMYDPILGRFISVDPYIQNPSNPQNFNRYAYCLNNPVNFTDPSGESIFSIFTGLLTGGVYNLLVQSGKGEINSFGDAVNALLGGASAALSEATSWAIASVGIASGTPSGTLLGTGIIFGKSVNDVTTTTSFIANPQQASRIYNGRYYTDSNLGAGGQVLQGLSRYTWEGLQTWAGYNWSQIRNVCGDVDVVDYIGGATYAVNENTSTKDGVSLGNYININIKNKITGSFEDWVLNDAMFMHEYGHTFDSRKFGPAYLFAIGIPSAISASKSKSINGWNEHDWFWTELRANRYAKRYFGGNYGADWSVYEVFDSFNSYYPIVRPTAIQLSPGYIRRINY